VDFNAVSAVIQHHRSQEHPVSLLVYLHVSVAVGLGRSWCSQGFLLHACLCSAEHKYFHQNHCSWPAQWTKFFHMHLDHCFWLTLEKVREIRLPIITYKLRA